MTEAHHRVVRYIISGGSGAVLNIAVLYICTNFFGIWYLISSGIAFLFAFSVSFYLQRTWTFKHHESETLPRHAALYLIVTVVNNFVLNTILIFIAVQYIHLWYIYGQVFAGGIVAVLSFFLYKHFVFKRV